MQIYEFLPTIEPTPIKNHITKSPIQNLFSGNFCNFAKITDKREPKHTTQHIIDDGTDEHPPQNTCCILMEIKDRSKLKFHRLTLNSIPLIQPYLKLAGSRSCDYTIGGIYMWIDYFKYHYCIYDSTLFIKGVAEDNVQRTAFSMPMGKMPLCDCVSLLKDYCTAGSISLEFSAITEEHINDFKALNPQEITSLKHWSDYIYEADKLATLAGNKLKKKRNHVNKFRTTYPDHHISPITTDNISDIKLFFDRLCAQKHDNGMAGYERNQTRKVLNDYFHYKNIFEGIALYVGADVAAFAIGEVIGSTLHVHIEKTDHDFNGANEFINMAFVQYISNIYDIDMVNREDDAGDDGLRQSKESYYPSILLKKYNVMF